ncbi:hypothetical protein AB0P21_09570 [Kribbella sp. NPDC056861]|uniref:hypothetical protein n=1 Tax=Kribbella sp. NPDC056861 TaxID=3154857 RepID=UPI00342C0485
MNSVGSQFIDATFYAQVVPEFHATGDTLKSARVARITQRRPEVPLGGSVLVRLTLRLPKSVLLPLRPTVVVIPENQTTVTVEVEEP